MLATVKSRRKATDRGNVLRVGLGPRGYDIAIRSGGLSEFGRFLSRRGLSGKVALVTDRTVAQYYAKIVSEVLKRAGFNVKVIKIPAGETAKTLQCVTHILDILVKEKFERGSLMVAVGGGVVGDVAGFTASVFLRGLRFIQVPTTLVAQVDSSIGGKTGVNHSLGKNLIGTFYQPLLVYIDPETLKTLPVREYVGGIAEVIKYGMILGKKFFGFLEREMPAILQKDPIALGLVIQRSCELKGQIVMRDEREAGLRRILNYGHTVGHALETLGRYQTHIHGEAVAIGMAQEAQLARYLGYCSDEVVLRQRNLLQRVNLPHQLPKFSRTSLWNAMKQDKKVAQEQVFCVFPTRIGKVVVEPIREGQFFEWHAAKV